MIPPLHPAVRWPARLAIATAVATTVAQASAPAPCQSRALGFDVADAGWRPLPMSKRKKDTAYQVIREDGRSVVAARAEGSASFYAARLRTPMQPSATIQWDWMTDALVPGADNRDRSKEDAPLRVIAAFDGDENTLPARERSKRSAAESLFGQKPPFAVLMYIWSDHVAPETVIPSAHTSQVKMLVVASGKAGLGAWQTVRRDLVADYKRAYDADPGPLLGVALLTDTDNTGGTAVGRYANLRLQCAGG